MPRFDPATLRGAARIHIPGEAAPPVRFAADELQRYLQRLTGVHVPIAQDFSSQIGSALILGASVSVAAASHDAETFSINPEPSRITLQGGSPRAVLSAVYALLERLGCRWSFHGASDEVVPRLDGAVALDGVEQTPRFAGRGYASDIMTWHYTQPEHFNSRLDEDRAFIDWMGKSGANAFLFIRHPFDTQLTIAELLPDFQRRGIDVEYGGHVIPLLLPRSLYREHPEYFPETAAGVRTDLGNLCTSNAAALVAVGANAVQYVRDYPEVSVIHIWGADLWQGGWCRCAACIARSVQDQSLRVCNAVARSLAAAGVARLVCYLAYHDTIEPDLTIRPGDNVFVEFAPRERCYGHALNDPGCATNKRYAAALERSVDWFSGRVRIFEYYGDAILFFGCAVPLTAVIAADLEYFRGLGIPEITMLQFGTYSLWAHPLNFSAFAAATMDGQTARSGDAYCARFAPHASEARETFTALERVMQRVVTYGDIRRPPRAPGTAAQVLARLEAALPRLETLADEFQKLGGDGLAAQAMLMRYSWTVLDGVREDIQSTLAGGQPGMHARYTDALQIMDTVQRRIKGLWGTVDLSIIHNYYIAAADAD